MRSETSRLRRNLQDPGDSESEDPATPDTMAESRRTRIKADILSVLTPSEKDIYRHLQHSGPQTALSIAKGLGKKYTRDVNPDLYKMMEKQLLEQKSRVWLIKASGGTENDGTTGEENLEDSGVFASDAGNDAKGKANYGCPTETAPAAIHLSGLQKQIYDFLKSNPPSKARTIAMALGMGSAKDVNPDLYRMKQSLFLSHDEKKLWSINTDLNKKSCGSLIPSSEDSAINQSYIEMDSGASSDDKDFRRDSGIGEMGLSPNNTMRDEPNPTGPLPGEIRLQYEETSPSANNMVTNEPNLAGLLPGESCLQYGSQMMNSLQTITKIYNINIQGCNSFTVGDTTWLTKGDTPPIKTGNVNPQYEYRDPDMAAQGAEPQQQCREANEWSVVNAEGPFSAPRTSSPVPSSLCEQTFNISGICNGLGCVTLDDRDNNGEECGVITSSAVALA